MDWTAEWTADPNERPLARACEDGGFVGIFRTIGCIGDSLSSGAMESCDEQGNVGYHDLFGYAWGQYIARITGTEVKCFSAGGMTAKRFWDSFGEKCGCFGTEALCQAYILALGVNDWHEIAYGSADDGAQAETFASYFMRIICRLRAQQPRARIFLMTMPRVEDKEKDRRAAQHAALMHAIAEKYPFTYVIDLYRDAPVYDEAFRKTCMMGNHLNAMGYILTARMTVSYIDYTIRHNMAEFVQVPFIDRPYRNCNLPF